MGTRPEIIKLAPVVRECMARRIPYFVIHTGQHYDYAMDKIFFDDLNIPTNVINLHVGSGSHGETIGKMIPAIERIIKERRPDVMLVQGDTNSALAGALAAVKIHIPVGHIEAGLRSCDRLQPEEYNRRAIDHISTYLFAPTRRAEENLHREGIRTNSNFGYRVYVTGNTIVDATSQALAIGQRKSRILSLHKLSPKGYLLLTLHREENVESKDILRNLLEGSIAVARISVLPLLIPLHPRTKRNVEKFGLGPLLTDENVILIEPLGYLDFLMLEANAILVLSDSGGVTEECCILQVPSVSLRNHSDRPETIEIGASMLAGVTKEGILEAAQTMMEKTHDWQHPFGERGASKKIIDILSAAND